MAPIRSSISEGVLHNLVPRASCLFNLRKGGKEIPGACWSIHNCDWMLGVTLLRKNRLDNTRKVQ